MAKFMPFDWKCNSCGSRFEEWAKPDQQVPCPNCNSECTRLPSAPRLDPRMGLDPEGNPTMGDRWARVREQRAQIERRHYKEHGTDMTPGADTAG